MAPMEKTWFYKRLFFELVIVMVKDEKYRIKDTMSIKVSLMHYMQLTRVMLPEVFEEFELIYMFLLYFFLFTKRSTIAKT